MLTPVCSAYICRRYSVVTSSSMPTECHTWRSPTTIPARAEALGGAADSDWPRLLVFEPLASKPACQMHVLDHDGDTLGVDGAKVLVKRESLRYFTQWSV